MSRVAIVGLGRVGLPLAVRAAEVGHAVVGLDVSEDKVEAIQLGRSYVSQVSAQRLARSVEAGRLRAFRPGALPERVRLALGSLQVGIVAVRSNGPGPLPLRDAARTLAGWLSPGALVVLEDEALALGAASAVAEAVFEESRLRPGTDYDLAVSAPRPLTGDVATPVETTPRVLGSGDTSGLARARVFYATLVERGVPLSTTRLTGLGRQVGTATAP